jgi:Ca2+-binding RTX toxin-like protein
MANHLSSGRTTEFDFQANGEQWIIDPGVLIASTVEDGVHSDFNFTTLTNNGFIQTTGDTGVEFDGSHDTIINNIDGVISGPYGVWSDGDHLVVDNFGSVAGVTYYGVGFVGNGGHTLNNSGTVVGTVDAEYVYASATTNNSGRMIGLNYGLFIANEVPATIVNKASGIIKGGIAAIDSSEGTFSLNNAGKIIGAIIDEANEHDAVINHGSIRGAVQLGGGNDVYNGNGGTANAVFGGDGVDHLSGGAAADRLHGGNNNDVLTGRGGADRFFFDAADSPDVDTITDFTPAQHDKIVLSESVFADLGPLGTLGAGRFHVGAPVNGNAQVFYTPGNGFLYYDPNGNQPGGTMHFATLSSHPVLHNTDFILEA